MIKIITAKAENAEVIARLGRITYTESHGHFIANKNDLMRYNESAFSVTTIRSDINSANHLFYIVYKDDLPIGYAKLVLNITPEKVTSLHNCQLERIYILNDFIPLKIGQHFLTFLEDKIKALQISTLWLSVYTKNTRAIRFYQRNGFKQISNSIFLINGKEYKNYVYSKTL